jgi:hypothetical protein
MGVGGATCVVYHTGKLRILAVKSDKRLGEGGTQTFIKISIFQRCVKSRELTYKDDKSLVKIESEINDWVQFL